MGAEEHQGGVVDEEVAEEVEVEEEEWEVGRRL